MKRLIWTLPLLLLVGCGFSVNKGASQIQLAIYTPLCVDVMDASTAPGAQLQIYPCGSGKLSQEWIVRPVDQAGDVTIVNENSAMCMSVADDPVNAPGQYVVQLPCGAGASEPNQVWSVVAAPSGESGSQIVSMASKQCLDLPYGATASIFPLQQYTCTKDDPAQGWVVHPVTIGNTP